MAWNTPGSGGGSDDDGGRRRDDRRPAWRPSGSGGRGGRGGNGLNEIVDRLRGLFGGGGRGIGRWIAVVVALWAAMSCFVLVTEQQRGVVLRFG